MKMDDFGVPLFLEYIPNLGFGSKTSFSSLVDDGCLALHSVFWVSCPSFLVCQQTLQVAITIDKQFNCYRMVQGGPLPDINRVK